jgi:hypothetical protein
MTIDGAQQSGKPIVQNAKVHAILRGLTATEAALARTQNWPHHGIFMPADLQSMLEANASCPYAKRNTYGK